VDGLVIISLRETVIGRLRLEAGDPSKLPLWTLIFIMILGVRMTKSKSKVRKSIL